MKKILTLFIVALSLTSCRLVLNAPIVQRHSSLYNYAYVYVVPTAAVTSSPGVYGGQYGVYGGATRTISPSEVIGGYLMKKGYTPIPSVTDDLADKTLVVSYGFTGRRKLGWFAYASCIIIQMRDAKTHQIVASCESEGCGSDETYDILQAITSGLNAIFTK